MLETGKKLLASGMGKGVLGCIGIMLAIWVLQGGCFGSNDSANAHVTERNVDSPVTKNSTENAPPPINGFQDSTNQDLRYARKDPGGAWVKRIVDWTGFVGSYTSIDVDSSGNVYISYQDEVANDLKVASGAP